jgi:hypothetical protein
MNSGHLLQIHLAKNHLERRRGSIERAAIRAPREEPIFVRVQKYQTV